MTSQIQGFKLSPQQRRRWALSQEGEALHAQCALRLEGRLRMDRLRAAVQAVVDRHDILRTTFHRTPGIKVPVQVVAEQGSPAWRTADLSGVSVERVTEEVELLFDEEAGRHDLEQGPVLRCVAAALPDGANALLLSLPAVCTDGWSLRNLASEVLRAYAGSPADEVVQYFQFSEWLHELLADAEAEVGREHWRRREARRIQPAVLPFERAAGHGRLPSRLVARRRLDGLAWPRIAAAAGALGATPTAFLLTAWQALLARLADCPEVVVGALVDGRKYEELHGALGPFSRALPVVARTAGDPTFAALLNAVRSELEDGINVQEYCDWEEELAAGSGAIGFELADLPAPAAADGVRASLLGFRSRLDRFKLKLTCLRDGEILTAEVSGDSARYDRAELESLAERFAVLLADAVERPQSPLSDLELLGEAERRRLLVDVNDTQSELPEGATLAKLLAAQALRTPDDPALEQGERRMTFAELDVRACQLARHLITLGAAPDSLVAVLLERSPDLVVALLAVLKSGAAYLPLDPGHPDERLHGILGEARPVALVTHERLAGRVAGAVPAIVPLDTLSLDRAPAAQLPASAVAGDHLAYVLYTSGSTGRPKGVMVTQRGLLNYLLWAGRAYPAAEGKGSPVQSPIVFDLTVTSLFLPLLGGRCAVLVPEEDGIEGFSSLVRDRGGFGLIKLTPAHLQVLTQWLQPEQAPGRAGALVLGGEALLAESLFFWRAHAPETRLINEYGPTETVVGCVAYEVRPGVPLSGPVPIGRPIANMRCYVLDRVLRPVPFGWPGELYLAGTGLARGYLARPDLTAERFVPDPFGGPGERLYRTGDMVRWREDGELVFIGRLDQQVKLHGYRIELGEIEAVLAGLPGVAEAVVLVREDTPGDPRLVAYYVPAGEPSPAGADLRAGLEAQLPPYMIPAALIALPELPLTSNGKINRDALLAPGTERPDLAQAYVAPESESEEILAAVVGQVLRLDQVGRLDNFFALGGDSIRSVQIAALARERGLEFNVEDLFQHQTIRELAASLGARVAAAEIPRTAPFELVAPEDRRLLPEGLEDAYPLTLLQAGMLYHMGLTAERPAFHNVNTWHIRAAFDAEKLQAAVDLVVARHPVMRTSFDLTRYGEPLQLVHPAAVLRVGFEDLRHLTAEEQAAALRELWERENRRLFDLAEAPLIRYQVHRRSDDTFQLTLTELHVVLDGWSTTSTLSEIFQAYFHLLRGEPLPEEPPLSLTFRDFVAAERRELAAEENRRFWAEKLRGSAPTRIPRAPATHRRSPGERVEKVLCPVPGEVFDGLRRLSRQEAVPLKSVLLAAHLKALSVLSGERDLVTALASNGRLDVPDGTRVRGLFLNMLPLRLELRGGSWSELARQAFEAERELLPYRRYPLAAIQKVWGGHDLSETLFNYLNFHSVEDVLRLGDGEILDDDEIDFSYTNFTFDACFLWIPLSLRMLLLLEYDPAELDRAQAQLYQGYYLSILETMAGDPRAPYDALGVLSAVEREQVLVAWNRTATQYPALAVHHLFAEVSARTPDAPALVFGDRRLSYGELDQLSNQLAHHLRALGIGCEDRVGICLDRSWEMVVGLLAILKAGGAYVPLDPAYPLERLAYMIDDAGVGVLLTRGDLAAQLPAAAVVRLDEDARAIAARPVTPLAGAADPESLAYVIYTSGSTGRPKGVAIPHHGVVRLVRATDYVRFLPSDRVGHASSVSFDAATFEIWGALLNGGCLFGIPRQVALDPRLLAERIREDGLSVVFLTPALFNEVAAQAPGAFASTRYTVVGGDALDPRWARAVLAHGAPRVALVNGYGPTEGTTFSVCHPVMGVPEDALSVPIGKPIANSRAYLLDGSLHPAPAGSPGELCIGGDGLARAYLNHPELTAERFVPDPCSGEPGQRLYRSGDLARSLPDGTIEFLGRRDQQVKIRGFRVEPGEVEAALRRLSAIREAAVAVRGSGAADKRLIAYIVWSERPETGAAALRDELARELPEHMLPAAFVELPALPLTPNGKIDRRALPEPDAAAATSEAAAWIMPRTPTEEALAAVWSQVLGVDRVGAEDTFFNLGGDSILGIRALAVARDRGLPLSLEQLFSQATLAETAREVEATAEIASLPDTAPFSLLGTEDLERLPAGLEDAYPVTQLQLGMLYHLRLEPGSPAYHNVNSWHLRAPFDAALFQRAVDRAVTRHAALRIGFELTGFREPLQLVHAEVSLPVACGDLRGLPAEIQVADLEALVRSEHARLFDLSRPPLVRLHIHRRTDESFQLTLTESHAVTDGWSTTSTLAEIFRDYLALVAGGEPEEAAAPLTSFRDFVLLERQAMASEEHRRFWEELLSGAQPASLPQWPAAPAGHGARAHKEEAEVPEDVLAGLRKLARLEAVSLKSVLLAAHAQVLGSLFGDDDILTGLTSNGRLEGRGGDRVRGLFLNTLPLRLRTVGGSWRDRVREAFQAERAALPYRRYPLAAIQKSWGRQALLEANFNYVNFHSVGEVLRSEHLEILAGGEMDLAFANFPLGVTFAVSPLSSRLRLELEVDASRVPAAQAVAIRERYLAALRAMAEDPAARADTASLLSPAEAHQLLVEWNDSAAAVPDLWVHELFSAQAGRTPAAIAAELGDQAVTFAELEARSNQLARWLRSHGVRPETLVALAFERSPELLVAMLAVLKSGGAFLPLDPSYPKERLAAMLEDARPAVLLTHRAVAAALPAGEMRRLELDEGAEWPAVAAEPSGPLPRLAQPESVAYVIYTSGSTGRPKGVAVLHRGFANFSLAMARQIGLSPGDRFLQFASLSFDASLVAIAPSLLTGATLILHRDPTALSVSELMALCRQRGVGLIDLPGALWRQTIRELAASPEKRPAFRAFMTGGESLSSQAAHEWAAAAGDAGALLISSYGPTEATVTTTLVAVTAQQAAAAPPLDASLGRILPNVRVYLLDRHLRPVPAGTPGELYIGGTGVSRGYLRRPEQTAAAFVPDLFGGSGDRLYRTGDLVRRLPDSSLQFIGRADGQVKIRGFRIELGEIESTLGRHPGVRDAIASVWTSPVGDRRLVAYVVPAEGAAPTVTELKVHLRAHLPESMIPTSFMVLGELPLDPNGKVNRRALPVPGADRPELQEAYVAPRSEMERILAGIWQEVLGVEKVGVQDNFFDLGGDSISLLRAHSLLQKSIGREIPMVELFEFSTVSALAEHLGRPGEEAAKDKANEEAASRSLELGKDRRRRQLEMSRRMADLDVEVE
jgi:amino acid adenylation domain-containing protein